MKRVDNSDVNIKLDSRIVYLSNFNAKFYTVNAENFFIRKTQDNVISAETEDNDTEYYIKLDWNELVTLGEGVLQYKIVNNVPDSDRADLYFNKNLERTTEYYINSNVTIDPESEQSYAEIIAELGVKIDTEIARSTSADTVHDEAIQDEVITRQQNVSDLTDLISANTSGITQNRSDIGDLSTELSNEITNRQNADTAISGAVDTVLANYLTISAFTEAEEIISASLNDLDDRKLDASAYTPTDLSNYYTKSEVYNKTEVDNAIAAIDVSDQLTDYLKISAFTQAEQTISASLNDLESSKADKTEVSSLFNTVNDKAESLSGAVATKLDTSAFTSYSGNLNTNLTNQFNNIDQAIVGLQNTKLSSDDFNTYSAATKTVIDGKLNTADFNSYSANTDDILSRYHQSIVLADQTAINANTTANEAKAIANTTFNSLTQSDWNESDSSKLSYIENKPFGETSGFVNIFASTGFSLTRCGQYNYGNMNGGLSLSEDLVDGEVYKVTVNGNDFIYTASTYNNILCLNFSGNPNVDTVTVFKSTLGGSYNISIYETYLNGDTSHAAISISKSGYQLVQIDNRYINYSGDTYIQSLVTRIEELETQVNEWKNNGINVGDY